MDRYNLELKEESHNYGDWVKYEDAESLENELAWALKRIEELEDELEDEREMTTALEKELKDYENPV